MVTKTRRELLCKQCMNKFTTKDRRRFKCYECDPTDSKKERPGGQRPGKHPIRPNSRGDRFRYASGFNGAAGSLFSDQFDKLKTKD